MRAFNEYGEEKNVDVTEEMPLKLQAIAQYRSGTATVEYVRCVEGLNAYRSMVARAGRGYAEGFYTASLRAYLKVFAEAAR